MITVSIFINGNPIITRSARNVICVDIDKGIFRYDIDDGSIVTHKRTDGAVVLAKKMLDTVREI